MAEALFRQLLSSCGQASQKKEPISIETHKAFVYKYAGANCLLGDLRITTLAILSFAFFFRINEPLKLRRSDIIFYPSHCSISIRNSKTDVYRLVTV